MKRNDGYDKFRDEAGNPAFDGYAALRPDEAAGQGEAGDAAVAELWDHLVDGGWQPPRVANGTLTDWIEKRSATPREASDAPDIVPVAWGAGKGMSGFMWITDLSAQADGWRKDGRGVEPLIRLSDHTDALAALRAELAAVNERLVRISSVCEGWRIEAGVQERFREAADAEVARLKDREKELVAGLEPFARVVALAVTAASHYDVDHASEVPDSQPYGALGIQWGDLRRARSLTAAKGG